jgi:hypothetical protein
MARTGEEIRNPLTRERLTLLKTSLDTDGGLLLIDWSLDPGGFLPDGAHVHPYQEARVEVVSDALDFRARPAPRLPRSLPPVRHRGVK